MKVLADGTVVQVENFSEARPKEKVQFESSQEMKDYLNDIIAYSNKQANALNRANNLALVVSGVVDALRQGKDINANLLDEALCAYQGSLLNTGDSVN